MSLLNGGIFKNQVRSLLIPFKISHVYQLSKVYIHIHNELFLSIVLSHKQVDPPLLPLNSEQGVSPSLVPLFGRQPIIVTARAKARLPDRSGGCAPIIDRTSDMSASIRVPLLDNNRQALF